MLSLPSFPVGRLSLIWAGQATMPSFLYRVYGAFKIGQFPAHRLHLACLSYCDAFLLPLLFYFHTLAHRHTALPRAFPLYPSPPRYDQQPKTWGTGQTGISPRDVWWPLNQSALAKAPRRRSSRSGTGWHSCDFCPPVAVDPQRVTIHPLATGPIGGGPFKGNQQGYHQRE